MHSAEQELSITISYKNACPAPAISRRCVMSSYPRVDKLPLRRNDISTRSKNALIIGFIGICATDQKQGLSFFNKSDIEGIDRGGCN